MLEEMCDHFPLTINSCPPMQSGETGRCRNMRSDLSRYGIFNAEKVQRRDYPFPYLLGLLRSERLILVRRQPAFYRTHVNDPIYSGFGTALSSAMRRRRSPSEYSSPFSVPFSRTRKASSLYALRTPCHHARFSMGRGAIAKSVWFSRRFEKGTGQ